MAYMSTKFNLSIDSRDCGCAVICFTYGNARKFFEDSCVQMLSAPVCSAIDGLIHIAISLLNGADCEKTVFNYPAGIALFKGRMKPDGNIELRIDDTVFTCPLGRYVRQLLKSFDSIAHEHSGSDDKSEWYRLLPPQRLELLRSLFHAKKHDERGWQT